MQHNGLFFLHRFLDGVSPPVYALQGVRCPAVNDLSQEGELVLLRCLHVYRNLTKSSECPQLVGIRCCKSPTYSTG